MFNLMPYHLPINANIVRAAQYDPTRTLTLRAAFVREMNKRFRTLRGSIREAIVVQDCFGLKAPQVNVPPVKGAFDFVLTQDKVNGFMGWLRNEMNTGILEIHQYEQYGTAISKRWTDTYIQNGYARGVERGRKELLNVGYNVPTIAQSGGLQAVLEMPMHVDRLGVLYSRAFSELKGITNWMDQSISKVLAEGLAAGNNPNLIARKLNHLISGVGNDLGITDTLGRYIPAERRARMLARTEIIRAHHMGTIQEYKNWEANNVIVQAEFSTAGDNRVCIQCSSLHGNIYTLEQIMPMIPVHPNCRCIALPANPKIKQQKRPSVRRTRTVDDAWKKDPVASRMFTAKSGRSYMSHKKRWTDIFSNMSAEEKKLFAKLKRSNASRGTGEWGRAELTELQVFFKGRFKSKFWTMDDIASRWMASTQKPAAQAFKHAARLTEKGLPKMVFKNDGGLKEMLAYIETKGGSAMMKELFLEMRAMSQAYLEYFYQRSAFELYRGVQGKTGLKILDNAYRTAFKTMKRTTFPMTDMPAVGYSSNYYTALDFATVSADNYIKQYGWSRGDLVFKSIVDRADIMIPRDLFSNLFRYAFTDEFEYMVRGINKEWDLRNMFISFIENNKKYEKAFNSIHFRRL